MYISFFIKDICGYFQCAPLPCLETGKVVWALLSTINGFASTQLSDILMSYRCSDIFSTKQGTFFVIKVCPKYLLTSYQN